MADTRRVSGEAALPRLLYIGDVSVADTMAGEALLFRLLQFYPPEKLQVICAVRPDMPRLPGVQYHHWGAAFPRLLHSRISQEYVLWRGLRYYWVPSRIASIARAFKPEALLTISHVSGWLAAWQLARRLHVPFHLIAHDDFAYVSRFPSWSRRWIDARFGEAYRAAATRFCISATMAETYAARFGAPGEVIYPTHKGNSTYTSVAPQVVVDKRPLTFAYGGSINSESDLDQILAFADAVVARQHRFVAYTPQHAALSGRAAERRLTIDVHPPVHSDELRARFRNDADCLFLPQSLAIADRGLVATAFPTKWSDYSTLGLPVLAWAPVESSSARFVRENPGVAELVTSADRQQLNIAVERLERDGRYRANLAERLLAVGREIFSPQAAWQRFVAGVTRELAV